jgi:Fur family ferric uptake transcriptional regulator
MQRHLDFKSHQTCYNSCQNYSFPMKNYIDYALTELKKTGLKITKPRQMIVSLLAKSDKALSPYEMRDMLKKKKINADVVTIYRILEVLEKIALAHKVLAFSGYIRCNTEKMAKTSCHHYLLCRKCHRVDEVEGENLHDLEKKISKKHKFNIQSHYLEFMGLCVK